MPRDANELDKPAQNSKRGSECSQGIPQIDEKSSFGAQATPLATPWHLKVGLLVNFPATFDVFRLMFSQFLM